MIKKLIGILLLGHLSLFASTQEDGQDGPPAKRLSHNRDITHQGPPRPAQPASNFTWVLDRKDGMQYNPVRAQEAQTFWEGLVYNVVEQTRESPTSTTPKPSIHSDPRQYVRSVSVPEWLNLPVTYSIVGQNNPFDAQRDLLGTNRVYDWRRSTFLVLRGVKPMGPPSSVQQDILQISLPVKYGLPGNGQDSLIRLTIATHGPIILQDGLLPAEHTTTHSAGWGHGFDFKNGLFSLVSMGAFAAIDPTKTGNVNAIITESTCVQDIRRLNGFQITYP